MLEQSVRVPEVSRVATMTDTTGSGIACGRFRGEGTGGGVSLKGVITLWAGANFPTFQWCGVGNP